jgi:RNA methyltransferase, TrmH family
MKHPPAGRQRLKDLARLTRKRHRDDAGLFLIEGIRSVESAVRANAPLLEVLVTEEAAGDARVATMLADVRVPIYSVPSRDLERVSDTQATQGVLAVARARLAEPSGLTGPVVALDGVQDPGNVGAVIRTAAWFGATGVLAGPGTADPLGPKAVRGAMGGLWDLDLAVTENLAAALATLRATGLAVFGADLEGEPVSRWSPPREAVLVLGSEARGLSPEVLGHLDGRVRIPGGGQRGGVESLNVTVAAGILLQRWLGCHETGSMPGAGT